jgi:glycosyltransferase involved in cell wall biosynthesis
LSRSCLNLTAHIDHRFGGLTTSVPLFCKAVERVGEFASPLAAFCTESELSIATAKGEPGIQLYPEDRLSWILRGKWKDQLRRQVQSSAIVHMHGLWQVHSYMGARLARECRRPYLVSAHGMLDPWAMNNRRLKKRVYWHLAESGNLEKAACLRALTRSEAMQYRKLGLKVPIAILPSGVEVPNSISAGSFFARFPELTGRTILLFLGRIHPKKGVQLLCESWAAICAEYPEAHLVMVGPDTEGTQAKLERLLEEKNVAGRVTFAGMLEREDKWSALIAADVFLLPSYSEGFSIALLEALGSGTPAIASKYCYFPELPQEGCGWVIEPERMELERALRECLAMPRGELRDMGERGARLVQDRYSWSEIGRGTTEVLSWMVGGDKPASVEVMW